MPGVWAVAARAVPALRSDHHPPPPAVLAAGKNGEEKDGGARQLLGMKGASDTDDKWKIRLQLMKPVTWVPLIWGVLCGAAASGEFTWTAENVAKAVLCMTMSGPLLTGYTQARGQRAWQHAAWGAPALQACALCLTRPPTTAR